ncbi:hypothetical protein D3C80_1425050 [compost metagenome]
MNECPFRSTMRLRSTCLTLKSVSPEFCASCQEGLPISTVLAVLMYWFFKLDINLPFAWFKLDKSCLCEYVERCFGYPYGGAVKKLT